VLKLAKREKYIYYEPVYYKLHYARTLKRRYALTKNGDTWSAHLRRYVTYYNVIGDVHKCTSLISQYRRRVLQTLVSHHWMTALAILALIGDACLVRRVSDYHIPQVNFCRLPAASCILPGFGSCIVSAETTSSHSHRKAHMDNTLIHKHRQKHKSI
jgi:hypothetical protein